VALTVLAPDEAYRRWAPTYEEAGALAALDELARRRLDPSPVTPLLDAACGTGRRLRQEGGTLLPGAFGIDLVLPMLLAGARDAARPAVAASDLRALPFPAGTFRSAWCRLAIGHVREADRVYAELGRVLAGGGHLFISDFHPEASRRGMARTFRSGDRLLAVEHHLHELDEHRSAATAAGLEIETTLELVAGDEVRLFFEAAGRLDAWERQRELPVLLALRLRRV
jgi:SAM-dependent methyltransferase